MSETGDLMTGPQPSASADAVAPEPAAAPKKRRRRVRRAEQRVKELERQLEAQAAARLTGSAKVGLLLTALLIVGTWWHAIGEMWHRWFPAWKRTAMPLTDRLTQGDSYYTHGPMVPIASAIIAYLIFRRVGLPCHRTRGSHWFGGLLLTGSLLLQLVAARADVTFVAGFALIGVLGGLIALWGGWGLLRAYWLPVAFLFFMVPLPMSMIADINFGLKAFAGDSALWLTSNVFNVAALRDGSTVHLPGDKMLVIENVCSGLRSLISLICFASLFALICRVKGLWRVFLLLMAVPVAIATNILRITLMNLAAHYQDVSVAGPGGWAHDFSGIIVFALALAIMFGLEWIIIKLSKVFKRDWTDPRLLGYLDELPKTQGQHVLTMRPIPLMGLGVVAAMSTMWALEAPSQNMSDVAGQAVSISLDVGGERFHREGDDREMDIQTRNILQTDDYLYRSYRAAVSNQSFDVSIVFSANNRKGTHPPEVCLEGGGARVISKLVHGVTISSGALSDDRELQMRELITENRGYKRYHLYTYKCGDSYTPDFFWQQVTIFLNGFIARNTAGALIRLDVPIINDDVEAARALALKAASAVMTEVDRGLP